ncbi:MAG: hypothetical protein NXI31_09455 [bacterium]|nr:hypothetical protein [bacterium]
MLPSLSRYRDIVTALPWLLLGFTLVACASASAVRLGESVFPARSLDHPIVVFELDHVPPERAHVRIGRIVGEGSDLMSFADIVEVMRVRARELGGDALILLGGGLLLSEGGGECGTISLDRTVHAVAIRWRE